MPEKPPTDFISVNVCVLVPLARHSNQMPRLLLTTGTRPPMVLSVGKTGIPAQRG